MEANPKIIFLDRDGVINEFPGNGRYVTKVKDFHFIPGALEGIRILTEAGYMIFIISNQAGVGKGVYTKDKLRRINNKLLNGVKRTGGKIKKSLYCMHRSDQGCDCRKPGTASIRKGLESAGKTIRFAKKTYFIGDTEVDIKAGYNAGCKTIFVLSGREDCLYMRRWDDVEPDLILKNLKDAALFITGDKNIKPITKYSKIARGTCNRRRRKVGGINPHRRSTDRKL